MGNVAGPQEIFSTMKDMALFGSAWMPYLIFAGALLGFGIGGFSLYAIKKIVEGIVNCEFDEASKQGSEKGPTVVVGDFVGDILKETFWTKTGVLTNIVDNMGNHYTKYSLCSTFITLLPAFGGFIAVFLLGFSGVIAYMAAYLATIFGFPRLERRQLILEKIVEVTTKAGYSPRDAKRISKRFYKEFRSWLKPGRSDEDIYFAAERILEQFSKQFDKES